MGQDVRPAQELWTAVDQYIAEKLVPADEVLEAAIRDSEAAGLPRIAVSACQGKYLHLLSRMQGARNILEIGTLGGYSTIWLARAVLSGGRVVTLEAEPRHAEIANRNIARAGLQGVVELRLGRALETLPKLAAEGWGSGGTGGSRAFDLIFIDADKENIPEYFQWGIKLARRGGVIIVDNVVRKGNLIDAASTDHDVQGVRRFHDMLANEKQVSAVTLQTVGSKGYDGFTMAVVGQQS